MINSSCVDCGKRIYRINRHVDWGHVDGPQNHPARTVKMRVALDKAIKKVKAEVPKVKAKLGRPVGPNVNSGVRVPTKTIYLRVPVDVYDEFVAEKPEDESLNTYGVKTIERALQTKWTYQI
jgi:hypothetical protein